MGESRVERSSVQLYHCYLWCWSRVLEGDFMRFTSSFFPVQANISDLIDSVSSLCPPHKRRLKGPGRSQAVVVIKLSQHNSFVATGCGAVWKGGHFSCLVISLSGWTHTLSMGTFSSCSSYCSFRQCWCPGQRWKLSENISLNTLFKPFSNPQGIATHCWEMLE